MRWNNDDEVIYQLLVLKQTSLFSNTETTYEKFHAKKINIVHERIDEYVISFVIYFLSPTFKIALEDESL